MGTHQTAFLDTASPITFTGSLKFNPGPVYVGNVSSNAQAAAAGAITQKQADNLAITTYKRSGLAHGITGTVETDTYCQMLPRSGTNGGLEMDGFSAGSLAFLFRGVATTPPTSSTAGGVVEIRAVKKSGTGTANIATGDMGWSLTMDDATSRLNIDGAGNLYIFDGGNFSLGTTTGTQIGTGITQKLGFYGVTAIVQRAGAAQAAVATTASTQTTPYGYTSAAQADAIVTLVNELRAWAVAQGFIKGAA